MSKCCNSGCSSDKPIVDDAYRRVLWFALTINAGMFVVEMIGGWRAGSVSLLADAIDFFGDAANYGVSLFVLGLAPVWRARTAYAKGLTMGVYGLAVLGAAAWNAYHGVIPAHHTMGIIGTMALLANLSVAVALFAYRNGDANMQSVWLCTRNDVIGNMAVLAAAVGVFGTGAGWPDLAVAVLMGCLGLSAARTVIKQAGMELAGKQVLKAEPHMHAARTHEVAAKR